MKLATLGLDAFGPFTGVELDLAAGEEGLHVVYGPNEAGKSSALRAIRALLFGIPEQSPDDFVHDYKKMRLRGKLQRADGRTLTFQRLKKRKDPLLDANGQPLAESELGRFLGGVTAPIFATGFALGHEELVQGGQQLLRGSGDVGESLFGTGVGVVGLSRLLDDLGREAEELFKPGGSKPRLNAALARHRAAVKEVKSWSLSGADWEKLQDELAAVSRERQRVAERLGELGRERARLSRIERALPRIVQRAAARERLGALGDVPRLREDFGEERRSTMQGLGHQTTRRDQLAREIAELEREIEVIVLPAGLVEAAEIIEELRNRRAAGLKAAQDSVDLEAHRRQLAAEAQRLLGQLRPGVPLATAAAEPLHPAQRTRIRELSDGFGRIHEAIEQGRREVRRHEEALAETQEELARADDRRDVSELARSLARIRKEGDLEARRADLAAEIAGGQQLAMVDVARLGFGDRSRAEIESLPVPTDETVERFRSALAELAERAGRLTERAVTARRELARIDQELAALHRQGEVRTEEDLALARQRRERGWQLVRRQYVDQTEAADPLAVAELAPALPLPEAYERSVLAADEVADRLRHDADRVARHAQLCEQQADARRELAAVGNEEHALAQERAVVDANWRAAWQDAGIDPLPPEEMAARLRQHRELLAALRQLRELERRATALGESIGGHRTELGRALATLGEPAAAPAETLAALLDRCEATVAAIAARIRQRQELEKRTHELARNLNRARHELDVRGSELDRWRAEWASAVAPLGLDGRASTGQAREVLDRFESFFQLCEQRSDRESRLAAIARDARQFEQDVARVVAELAPDLAGHCAEEAARALAERLQRAQKDTTRLAEKQQQLGERQQARGECDIELGRLDQRLRALLREAGVADAAEFPAVEDRAKQAREARRIVEEQERLLLEDGAGAALEEILEQAGGQDRAALPAKIAAIEREIAELETLRLELEADFAIKREACERRDGTEKAAEAAEAAERILAELAAGAERYARLRLAQALLRREIERYRREHQGPLLARASELFRTMTLGRFDRLEVDHELGDHAVLVGVRPSAAEPRADRQVVEVGQMSDGTADQLYLALRLAALEHYAASNEPLPLIVDDVLIRYDDERARASLRVLAELSQKVQVIFFTHHARLVEIARDLGPGLPAFVHELPGPRR